MFIILSCDQASDQHNSNLKPNDDVALTTRGDCDLCPGDDECCCAVWYQPTQTGTFILQFCGTSTAGTACIGAPTGNCPSFSGVVFPGRLQLWITVKPFVLTKILPSTFIIHIPLTQLGLLYHARLI